MSIKNEVYITGDTHGNIDYDKLLKFNNAADLTRNDIVIIAGDWGGNFLIKDSLSPYYLYDNKLKFTTVVVLGNHENYDYIESLPIIDKFNGKVYKASESVFILQRGHYYSDLNGLKIWNMGGGLSIDKKYRQPHVSWWPQEIPSHKEFENALETLDNIDHNNIDLDYVITHVAPKNIIQYLKVNRDLKIKKYNDSVSEFLCHVYWNYFLNKKISYKKWFFAHYHIDQEIKTNEGNIFKVLFNDIIKIK